MVKFTMVRMMPTIVNFSGRVLVSGFAIHIL